VLNVAGNHCNVVRHHRPLIAPHAKFHPAVKHPNNLLVRMFMWGGTCTSLDSLPHDHCLLSRKDAALNFIVDALPRQFRKRAEARHHGHGFTSVYCGQL
jgi:hypothetical protein